MKKCLHILAIFRSESCSSVASSGSSSPSPLSAPSPSILPLPNARRRGREQAAMSSPRRQQRERKVPSQSTTNRPSSIPQFVPPSPSSSSASSNANANCVSLMRQLQEERRQRWEEYRSNRREGQGTLNLLMFFGFIESTHLFHCIPPC